MAHFAELDANNVVTRVIVVDNKEIRDVNGIESEQLGIAYCQKLYGIDTNWKQTSYNGNMRFRYAGVGYTYDPNLDAFIFPKQYPSWVLNEATAIWEPPIPAPERTQEEIDAKGYYEWDESSLSWVLQLRD